MIQSSKWTRGEKVFFGGLLLFTMIRCYLMLVFPLTGDEAYHWEWARHLDIGYYDHPPMVAWLIAFFTTIGGNSLFWTRLTALLCSTGTTYFTYRLAKDIGGEKVGVTAGLFSLTAMAMSLAAVVVTTDSPLIFFWQLTVYLVWRALQPGQSRFWYWAGAALGLGLLSKLLIVPLIPGVLLVLILSEADRVWLKRKEPYLAMGLALLLFSPFLIWNSQHGWTSFVFQFTRHEWDVNLFRPLQFLAAEAGILGPVLFAGMLWAIYRLVRTGLAGNPEEKRIAWFILCCGWILPGIIFLDSARNLFSAHWPLAAYGVGMIGLAWELLRNKPKTKRLPGAWFWGTSLGYGLIILTVLVLIATHAFNPEAILGKTVRGHGLNQIYGWREIGRSVSQIHAEAGSDLYMATSSYVMSSMISFYTPDHLYVGLLGPGSKHGRAYDMWDPWAKMTGQDVLFISEEDPADPQSPAARILKESFTRSELYRIMTVRQKGQELRKIYFTLGIGLKPDPYAAIRAKFRW